jgi:phycoerythrobilin:ferredoxin oxidoreductase
MFKRFYGEEWTEEYIHGFLFDLERQMAISRVGDGESGRVWS